MSTFTITADHATETSLHKFSTEASSLGLRPGQVPRAINTTLGNGQPFLLVGADAEAFRYRQMCGIVELTVFND